MRSPVLLSVVAFIAVITTVTAFSVPGVSYKLLALAAPAWVALVVGWAVWVARGRPGRAALVHPAIVIVLVTAVVLDLPLRARFESSRPAFEAMIGRHVDMPSQQGLFIVDVLRITGPGEIEFVVRNSDIDGVAWGFSLSFDGPPGELIDGPLPIREQRYRLLDGNWYVWAIHDPNGSH